MTPDHKIFPNPVLVLDAQGIGATDLAASLGVPCLLRVPVGYAGSVLTVAPQGLSLSDAAQPRWRPLVLRFRRPRRAPGPQPLARAMGGPGRRVVDATAGWGRDAFHLASLGCEVTAVERHPVLVLLLEDAQRRAALVPTTAGAATRLRIRGGDAREVVPSLDPPPEVIYLDPMYPPRRKRSALAARELRMLRHLVGTDADAVEVFTQLRGAAQERVVVKRPRHAPPLVPGVHTQYCGKLARYDVYRPRRTPGAVLCSRTGHGRGHCGVVRRRGASRGAGPPAAGDALAVLARAGDSRVVMVGPEGAGVLRNAMACAPAAREAFGWVRACCGWRRRRLSPWHWRVWAREWYFWCASNPISRVGAHALELVEGVTPLVRPCVETRTPCGMLSLRRAKWGSMRTQVVYRPKAVMPRKRNDSRIRGSTRTLRSQGVLVLFLAENVGRLKRETMDGRDYRLMDEPVGPANPSHRCDRRSRARSRQTL